MGLPSVAFGHRAYYNAVTLVFLVLRFLYKALDIPRISDAVLLPAPSSQAEDDTDDDYNYTKNYENACEDPS